ncbi:MAG: rod shape-determining protein MreD [Pseudomonadota bacterium]
MVDPITARVWTYRALFAGLVLALALGRLLPDAGFLGGLPGPDLILAFTVAWVLRRPAYAPAWLIVAVFLPLDFLLHQAPGIGALAILLLTEFLRARQELSRSLPFSLEWALVAAVLLAMVAGTQLLMGLFLVPRPPLGLDLVRALFTAAIYPLGVVVTQYVFKVRKASPGEVDALGARL